MTTQLTARPTTHLTTHKPTTVLTTKATTVADLATTIPQSITVLEKLGIDYCCHGQQTIDQACRARGITTDELLMLINAAPKPSTDLRTWEHEPMSEMIGFIVATHHEYTREALAMLPALAARVFEVHGANHEELRTIAKLVQDLADELLPHMLKEEQVLFPYVKAVEEAGVLGNQPPAPFFGTARNPIRMMMLEHEAAGEKLVEIRTLTDNFSLPAEACTKYRTLFAKVEELEQDLHRHIHLENNMLFPRAIEAEEKTRTTPLAAVGHHCCVG